MSRVGTFGVIDLASAVAFRTQVVRLDPPDGCSLLDDAAFFDSVAVGPWLIDLDRCEALRKVWVAQVRDAELGYTIQTTLTLPDLRRHLRKFALAELEGRPKPVFFRYFDARIIRVFLAETFTDEQKQSFLAPMLNLEVKAADKAVTLVFEPTGEVEMAPIARGA